MSFGAFHNHPLAFAPASFTSFQLSFGNGSPLIPAVGAPLAAPAAVDPNLAAGLSVGSGNSIAGGFTLGGVSIDFSRIAGGLAGCYHGSCYNSFAHCGGGLGHGAHRK